MFSWFLKDRSNDTKSEFFKLLGDLLEIGRESSHSLARRVLSPSTLSDFMAAIMSGSINTELKIFDCLTKLVLYSEPEVFNASLNEDLSVLEFVFIRLDVDTATDQVVARMHLLEAIFIKDLGYMRRLNKDNEDQMQQESGVKNFMLNRPEVMVLEDLQHHSNKMVRELVSDIIEKHLEFMSE